MAKTEDTPHEAAEKPAADSAQQAAHTPTHEYSAPEFDTKPDPQRPKYNLSISRNVLVAAAVVLGVGLSFIAGAQFEKHRGIETVSGLHAGTMDTDRSNGMGEGGRYGARMGGAGTVTAVSSSSITITLRSFGPDSNNSGTSKTYTIDSSTEITINGSTGSVSDIKTGDTVFVRTSSSSSTIATRISVGDMPGPGASTQGDTGTSTTTSNNADTTTI